MDEDILSDMQFSLSLASLFNCSNPDHDHGIQSNSELWENLRKLFSNLEDEPYAVDNFVSKFEHKDGNTLLHQVCMAQPPVDVLRLVVHAAPKHMTIHNEKGNTPLHNAILHNASSAVVHYLIEADTSGQTLLMHNTNNETPICIAADPRRLKRHGLAMAQIILEKTYCVMMNSPPSSESVPLLTMAITCSHMIGPKKTDAFFRSILEVFPEQAQQQDPTTGCYPLHLAIMTHLGWEEGVETLWKKFPESAEIANPATGLYPIMSAALACPSSRNDSSINDGINTLYLLLNNCPGVMEHLVKELRRSED